jgi:hypothetical protein
MKHDDQQQFIVKGVEGRRELYAVLAASEFHNDTTTFFIGDPSDTDDLWWKRTIEQKNGNGQVSAREITLDIEGFEAKETKRGGEIPFSLSTKQQAYELLDAIRENDIRRLVLIFQSKEQKRYLDMVLAGHSNKWQRPEPPELTVYHMDAEWYDYEPQNEDEECITPINGAAVDAWDTLTDVENEKDLSPVIKGIAHEGETTWIGALPKVGKTWVLFCILLALLTGMPLFGDERLTVPNKAKRCIYLCPEAGRGPIKKRLQMLRLVEHLYDPITNPDGRLYLRTLSKGQKIPLNDPMLLELIPGADIFIDTAVRYLEGDENAVKDVRVLTENILNLLAVGARSVWVAHHAPKGFENASTMTLQNMFRGSGEFGAALTNAYGLCTEDALTTKLRFHCICGRDLDEYIPDMILQGSPYLYDIGNFKVVSVDAEPFKGKGGAPSDSLKQQKIDYARSILGSYQEKTNAVNAKFGSNHKKSTIYEWLQPFDADKGVSHE